MGLTLTLGFVGHWLGHDPRDGGAALAGKFWQTVGYCFGETSFDPIPERGFAGALIIAARLIGMLFLTWAVIMLFWRQLGDWVKSWLVKSWKHPHVIVIGAGRKGSILTRQLLEQGERVVVVERRDDASDLDELREAGAVIFVGNARSQSTMKSAGLLKARETFIPCGSDEENYRQAVFIEQIFVSGEPSSSSSVNEALAPPVVQVRLEDQAFRNLAFRNFLDQRLEPKLLDFHGFGFNELAARSLARRPKWMPMVRDGETLPHLHVIVFGFGEQAKAIVLHHLRILHLREEQRRIVTVVCSNAAQAEAGFLAEFPCLSPGGRLDAAMRHVCEGLFPELEFVEMPGDPAEMRLPSFRLFRNARPGWRLNIVFCLDDDTRSQGLRRELEGFLDWCRQRHGSGFECECACAGKEFGDMRELCAPESIRDPEVDAAARQVMMFYARQYGKASEDDAADTRSAWNQQTEWERESCRHAADHVFVKLAVLGNAFDDALGLAAKLEQPDVMTLMAKLEHHRWCAERLLAGWRPLPNEERKNWESNANVFKNKLKWHLDLIPFNELTEAEQEKDYGFIRALPDFIRALSSNT